MGDARVGVVVEPVEMVVHERGALDLAGVAADLSAPVVEDGALVTDRLEIADAVPDVGVLGDDPERHLLADARNEHGDLARGRRVELREALLDHGQRGVESA